MLRDAWNILKAFVAAFLAVAAWLTLQNILRGLLGG